MKAKIYFPIGAVLFGASIAYADSTSFNATGGGNIIDNGSWVDIARFSNGTPTSTTDFTIQNGWSRILGNSTLEVNNLAVSANLNTVTSNQYGSGTGQTPANQESMINNGTFDYSTYVAPNLIVNGNLTVVTGDVNMGSAAYKAGFEQILIKGDIQTNTATIRFGYDPNTTYSESYYALDVGGVVILNRDDQRFIINRCGGSSNASYADITCSAYVRLGGLTGIGNIVNNDSGAVFTQVVFQAQSGKTFSGGDWTGELRGDYGTAPSSTMRFVMDDAANSNTQTMRVLPATTSLGRCALQTLDFEVRNGTLGLYIQEQGPQISINMSGGNLLIQGYNESFDAGHGEINTSKIELGGGKIHFDVGNDSMMGFYNDVINADEISGDGSTQIVINLLGADFDLGDYISFSDLKIFDNVQTSSVEWSAVSVSVKYNGMDVTSGFGIDLNYNGTDAVLLSMSGVIPEASHYAAILGLIALGIAAYRRKH